VSLVKPLVGRLAAKVVQATALTSKGRKRPLNAREWGLLERVFGDSLDLVPIVLHEGITGPLNVTRTAFVIENTIHLPKSYLPLPDPILVHEACHVWQFQHGGHAYISDSIEAQLFGEGYDLKRPASRGLVWERLNCEQQAALIEHGFAQGCLDGKPFRVGLEDHTQAFRAALAELRAGRGASFSG